MFETLINVDIDSKELGSIINDYGEMNLFNAYNNLNIKGKREALKRIVELSKIKEYIQDKGSNNNQ